MKEKRNKKIKSMTLAEVKERLEKHKKNSGSMYYAQLKARERLLEGVCE